MSALGDAELDAAVQLFDDLKDRDLAPIWLLDGFEPENLAEDELAHLRDAVAARHELDRRLISDLCGLPEESVITVREIGEKLCREPQILGKKGISARTAGSS